MANIKPRVISLFSGCGGMDWGFKEAGFKIVWANDIDESACKTYKKQFKLNIHPGDIAQYKEFPQADVVIGGFPCQGFSIAGNRLKKDPRNKLYKEFSRVVGEVKPKFFIAENVPGLLTMSDGKIIKAIAREFRNVKDQNGIKTKYIVSTPEKPLNAKDYGVAQDRKRIFIVGVRKDLGVKFEFPEETHGANRSEPYVKMRDVIKNQGITNIKKERFSNKYSTIYMSRNRRRSFKMVSFTIQAGGSHAPQSPYAPPMRQIPRKKLIFGKGEKKVWIFSDKSKAKRMSWRECAAVQSFPLDYKFEGSLTAKYMQIGNAVPPKLAEAIARQIKKYGVL